MGSSEGEKTILCSQAETISLLPMCSIKSAHLLVELCQTRVEISAKIADDSVSLCMKMIDDAINNAIDSSSNTDAGTELLVSNIQKAALLLLSSEGEKTILCSQAETISLLPMCSIKSAHLLVELCQTRVEISAKIADDSVSLCMKMSTFKYIGECASNLLYPDF